MALGRVRKARRADWGRRPRRHPRGLTSNRHARRPDRQPIRAFAHARCPKSPCRDERVDATAKVSGISRLHSDPRTRGLFHAGFGLWGRRRKFALTKGNGAMDRNVGPEDRVVRIVVAIGLAVLAYLGV